VPFIGTEGEGGDWTVRWWWWLSGPITPAISAMNEGEMMRVRGSGNSGVYFGEERGQTGRWPGVAAHRCSGARWR
jgi:hypothetical protein